MSQHVAARLKVFALGLHSFVSAEVIVALGLPRHVRQARVLISASTKREAIKVLESVHGDHVHLPRMTDPEFRLATGTDVDVLLEAGLLDTPKVLIFPMLSRGQVVEVNADGLKVVGELEQTTIVGLAFKQAP